MNAATSSISCCFGKSPGIRRFLNKIWHSEKLSFAEGHASDIDYRMDVSLPFLYRALKA